MAKKDVGFYYARFGVIINSLGNDICILLPTVVFTRKQSEFNGHVCIFKKLTLCWLSYEVGIFNVDFPA